MSSFSYPSISRRPRLSLILIYALAQTLVSPFAIRRTEAAPTLLRTKAETAERLKRKVRAGEIGWREGELLVRFKDQAPTAKLNALLRSNGAQWGGRLRGESHIERIRLSAAADPEVTATALRSSPLVEYAEPNYLIRSDQTARPVEPTDQRYAEQWALENLGAPAVWQRTTGSAQTLVAVIDSGIDFKHPDLKGNLWENRRERPDGRDEDGNDYNDDLHGWDYVTDSAVITDAQGHGTMIAGIIAAAGDNAKGVSRVMWRAGLMSLRVLDQSGTGDIAYAVEAIDYANANGAQVINCSWGTQYRSNALFEAIGRAESHGVIVVASAGNDGLDVETEPHYPASYELPNLLSVAASEHDDGLISSSNWGESHIAIAAPGAGILTTVMGGDYGLFSGTSASAAFVTGMVGLIRTLRPWLSSGRTRGVILGGARHVQILASKLSSTGVLSGVGTLRALDALPEREGTEETVGINGGERSAAFDPVVENGSGEGKSGPTARINPDRNRTGNEYKVKPPERTQGAPGTGLPDLDGIKGKHSSDPKPPDPIPSTRCAHNRPDCTKEKERNRALIDLPVELIAAYFDSSPLESGLIDHSGLIQDSPFNLWLKPLAESGDRDRQRTDSSGAKSGAVPFSNLLPQPPLTPPGSYNAVNDFSPTQNSGVWKYGYKPLSGTTFSTFPSRANLYGSGLDSWSQGACCPMLTRNGTGTTYAYPAAPSVVQPTDLLNLHPGPSGEKSVVRWTAPSAGTYIITGRFQAIDTVGTTSDVAILHNSASIFTSNINGYGNQAQFSLTRTVATGDTIDFQVGYGLNSSFTSDSTGLAAAISRNLSVESVTWTSVSGVTASGNNLLRSSGAAWDGGAVSTRQLTSGDGYVEFTASETNTHRMCGLSNGNSNQNYSDIDFALYPAADGYLYIYESGVNRGQFGAYSPGVRLRVSVENGVIKYWKNGALIATSATAPTYPLLVDTSLYSPGSTVTNVSIAGNFEEPQQNVFWTNLSGVTATGNNLTRPTGFGWDGGAVSIQTITGGDGYVEFSASETNTHRMCGLSNGSANQSYTEIDYALYPAADGNLYIYENGINRGQFGPYSVGDRLRVAVEGGTIRYRKNGTLLWTSATAPTYPLVVDTSLYNTGATITDAVIYTGASSNSFSAERAEPANRTGTGGVDLLSRNAGWNLPLLVLPGRAGLDLDLTLNYNSLVWTKSQSGQSIKFDADQGNPAPGFRLGFPVIQPRYYNSQTGANAYLLITRTGGHTELRQIDATTYESTDATYLQLKDNGGTLTLRPTDGSQLTYAYLNGQYLCTQIKDRNGNFITVEYWDDGRIRTVTDTLGRVVNFNYDAYLNLISITQMWDGQQHTWATFGWGNQIVNTGFTNQIIGTQNGTSIPMLTQVGYADGTRYNFEYTGYLQVARVRHYAADNHQTSYTTYIHTSAPGANDCPRLTESRIWGENWSGQNNVPMEVATQFSSAVDYSWGQATMPDGTVYKEIYATAPGWKKGLETGTELWAGGVRKKWTTTDYTQTNVNLPYPANPRVIETNVHDSEGNRRRAVIEYSEFPEWGLPSRLIEYAADGTTEIRHTFTGYQMSQPYLDRRIIGLVSAVNVSDTRVWQSIIQYSYDAGGSQLAATPTSTIQHDAAYGSLATVRGNLTTITRFDTSAPDNASARTVTQIGYDTNGSVIFSRDPLNHQNTISYTDSFSDGNNTRNTYAYPTRVTPPLSPNENPAGFGSTSQYNYSSGAVTLRQGPAPKGFTAGPVQTFEYDAAGRIDRTVNMASNAIKRWVYDPAGHINVYSTLQPGGPEFFSATIFDGMGRVRANSVENPNSAGGFRSQYTFYDVMGRIIKQSNPTETASSWTPAGDDSADGWVWTLQAYDWKGRPVSTTNADGSTKTLEYGGCGCAGGETVAFRDEMGRRQRMTADVFGRLWKTEILNWDQTVYSSTTNTYDALNRITSIYQTGANVPGQTTTLTYDGHGRLKTQKLPIQNSPSTYLYNADDTLQSMTDARGASATFAYDARQQPTSISYNAPAGVSNTQPVTYTYDAAGNRTAMTDASGSVSYAYDGLSRLVSESRKFTGLTEPYNLVYSYNQADELTSITDPTGAVINYSYDKTGRLTDITGSPFAGVTQYAANIRERAWGAVKSATYGDNGVLAVSYNSRLLPTDFAISGWLTKHYEYYADGRLRYSKNNTGDRFDRSYTFDHAGRVTEAFSGPKARGLADTDQRPYDLYYQYDPLGHLTSRGGRVWSGQAPPLAGSYMNNRNGSWSYDADGRLLNSQQTQYSYDAAGRAVGMSGEEGDLTQTQEFDGNGARTRLTNQLITHNENGTTTTETKTQYFVTSSVLKDVVTELGQTGQKERTFVYQGGNVLAWQQKSGSTETMAWEHRDISNASIKLPGVPEGDNAAELEPFGMNAGLFNPNPLSPTRPSLQQARTYPGFADLAGGQCRLDYIDTPCEMVQNLMNAGATAREHMVNDQKGLRPERYPIIPLGLGLFVAENPVVKWDEEGSYLDTDERFFTSQEGVVIGFETLWDDLNDILTNDECRSFIADLIRTAQEQTGKKAHSFTVEGMLEELKRNPLSGSDDGIFLYKNGAKELIGYGGWDKKTGKGWVEIGEIRSNGVDIRAAHRDLARMFLHEIIHTATKFATNIQATGGFSDVELARAVYTLSGDSADNPNAPANNPPGSHPTTVGGVIYNRALQKHCR